jgi:hypothetical protein
MLASVGVGSGAFAFVSSDDTPVARKTSVVEEAINAPVVGDAPTDDASVVAEDGAKNVRLNTLIANQGEKPADLELAPIPAESVEDASFDAQVSQMPTTTKVPYGREVVTTDPSELPTVAESPKNIQKITMDASPEYDDTFADALSDLAPASVAPGAAPVARVEQTRELLVIDSLRGLKDALIDADSLQIKDDVFAHVRETDDALSEYRSLDDVPDELLAKAIDPIVLNSDMLKIAQLKAAETTPEQATAAQSFLGITICKWNDDNSKKGQFAVDSDQIKGSDGNKYSPTLAFNEGNEVWSVKGSLVGYFKGSAEYNIGYGVYKCLGVPVWARLNRAEFVAKAKLGVQGTIEAQAKLRKEKTFSKSFATPALGYAVDAGVFKFGLYASAQLDVGVTLEASIEAKIKARVNAEGDAEWKFECVSGTPCRQVSSKHNPMKFFLSDDSQASVKAKLSATPFIEANIEAGAKIEAGKCSFAFLSAGAGARVAVPISLTFVACLADLDGDNSPEASMGLFADMSVDIYAYWQWSIVGHMNWGQIHLISELTAEAERIAKTDPSKLKAHLAKKVGGWMANKLPATERTGGKDVWAIRKSLFSVAIGDFSKDALRPVVRQTNEGISAKPQQCYPFGENEPLYEVEINGVIDPALKPTGHFTQKFTANGTVRVRQVDDTMERKIDSPWVQIDVIPSDQVRLKPEEVTSAPETNVGRNMRVTISGQKTNTLMPGARATVTVLSPAGEPVEGAVVTGEWNAMIPTLSNPTTDAGGMATFDVMDDDFIAGRKVTFTVTKVQAPGHKVFAKSLSTTIDFDGNQGSSDEGDTCDANLGGGRGHSVRPRSAESCAAEDAIKLNLAIEAILKWGPNETTVPIGLSYDTDTGVMKVTKTPLDTATKPTWNWGFKATAKIGISGGCNTYFPASIAVGFPVATPFGPGKFKATGTVYFNGNNGDFPLAICGAALSAEVAWGGDVSDTMFDAIKVDIPRMPVGKNGEILQKSMAENSVKMLLKAMDKKTREALVNY